MGSSFLELDAVTVHSERGDALLSDVSFGVSHGVRLAVVGPNGAGKTTLLRTICGLLSPDNGEIRLNGRSLQTLSFEERARQIAYVGQADDPDGRLSVTQYVGLGTRARQDQLSQAETAEGMHAILDALGLGSLADKRMDRISGGERQKAKIARALCQKPDLLVLDEPTNHLDPRARGDILNLVSGFGMAVIAALHDLTLIDSFADKVALLDGGRLIDLGSPSETLSTPNVRQVFDVDLLRLAHPDGRGFLPTLDLGKAEASRERSNTCIQTKG
ncbi:ABC transporter ATP-binding protein [Coralliovum pocilloporae]|uniref:ABC transporter ATP-binding protein n=1 Tax=Coralliovum pocilloporae TaxID=3066369 RepID=UPI003307AAC7